MRLCIFYDAEGPNGSQFAVNPEHVTRVDGDDESDGSESLSTEQNWPDEVRITLRDGTVLYPCNSYESTIKILEGEQDLRSWNS